LPEKAAKTASVAGVSLDRQLTRAWLNRDQWLPDRRVSCRDAAGLSDTQLCSNLMEIDTESVLQDALNNAWLARDCRDGASKTTCSGEIRACLQSYNQSKMQAMVSKAW
jgi:hypothetical protein